MVMRSASNHPKHWQQLLLPPPLLQTLSERQRAESEDNDVLLPAEALFSATAATPRHRTAQRRPQTGSSFQTQARVQGMGVPLFSLL
jgi:hypothetical protein